MAGRNSAEFIDTTVGPSDPDDFCRVFRTEPEMKSQVILRAEASAASDFVDHRMSAGFNTSPRSNRASVGFCSNQLKYEGLICCGRRVVEDCRRIVQIIHHDIDLSGVEQITERSTPGYLWFEQRSSSGCGNILECTVPATSVQNLSLCVV
jgi:hypothetical protein